MSNRNESVNVDSGTHAGSHVPVAVLFNMMGAVLSNSTKSRPPPTRLYIRVETGSVAPPRGRQQSADSSVPSWVGRSAGLRPGERAAPDLSPVKHARSWVLFSQLTLALPPLTLGPSPDHAAYVF